MNFGQNAASWLSMQVGALFLAILGAVAVYYLAKREFSRFLGFMVFAMFVAVFVFSPDSIKVLGQKMFQMFFG